MGYKWLGRPRVRVKLWQEKEEIKTYLLNLEESGGWGVRKVEKFMPCIRQHVANDMCVLLTVFQRGAVLSDDE